MISVTMIAVDLYEVVVGITDATGEDQSSESRHEVRMPAAYYQALTGRKVTHEWLIAQSFRFLLERMGQDAIVAEFALADIAQWYPEYEADMRERLRDR